MNKQLIWKINLVLGIIIIGFIVFISLLLYVITPPQTEKPQVLSFSTVYIPERFVHFATNQLTYSQWNCNDKRKELNKEAFEIIANETNNTLAFSEVNTQGHIRINCFDDANRSTLGDSAPIIKFRTKEIDYARINIYYNTTRFPCGYPSVEIHEILHGFGIAHRNSGLMLPTANCNRLTDETEIKEHLKYIYSSGRQGTYDKTMPSKFIDDADSIIPFL